MSANFNSNEPQTIAYRRIIDLSHAIAPTIPLWPGDPPVEFESVAEIGKDGYYLRKFSMGEHSATHINAPNSFAPEGLGIESFAASSLVVPAIAIDLRHRTLANPDYALALTDIFSWEQNNQPIPTGSLVLLYTGWQEKWGNSQEFFKADDRGQLHFPGFGLEAAQWLVKERTIAGIGIDTHGVDPGIDDNFTVNKFILSQSKIVLENLTNLDKIPPTGTTLVIGILRLIGGSGSPVSVLGFIP